MVLLQDQTVDFVKSDHDLCFFHKLLHRGSTSQGLRGQVNMETGKIFGKKGFQFRHCQNQGRAIIH